MHSLRYRIGALSAMALLVCAAGAWAQSPQTIVLDGVNDFLGANLVDADGGDTQHPQIDIGNTYVTNDAINLYVGFEHDQTGFGNVQLGIAIDVNTPAGGTTDPWGRAIEWTMAVNKPDYMFYVNLDNNWQAGYTWSGTAWNDLVTAGPGALSWQTGTGFKELGLLLSSLGVSASDQINVEIWVTQDGSTKGPLDLVAGDAFQLSTPSSTLWDTTTPIPLMEMFAYFIQAAADPDPPLVTALQPTAWPVDSFFDVYFNEPVDGVTSDLAGNYSLSDGTTILTANRDPFDLNVVHLELLTPLTPSTSLYQVTVTNVQDVAGNTIVNDGVGNVACVMLKEVYFRGRMGPYLANNSSPPDGFSVEGDQTPLTFGTLCDTGNMTDTLTDDIWEFNTIFAVAGDCAGDTAEQTLEWKFAHNCTTYEPMAGNRVYQLSLTTAAVDTIEVWWNDEDPSQFTTHEIDVELFVDMNVYGYAPGDTVAVNGSVLPLTHDWPSLNELADDGLGNDASAGDGIYSTVIRFPLGSDKDVSYKFLQNGIYECFGQGDRYVFLDDTMYDIVGGALGPLTLPVVHYDRCATTWRAVEVVFSVDLNGSAWESLQPGDVISINGTASNDTNTTTLTWDIPSVNPMADDGLYPDLAAGDKIFAISIVFPDSSQILTEYKYLYNDLYECQDFPNRSMFIVPDLFDDTGNPQILPTDEFQRCYISDVVNVPRGSMMLEQNAPNPFNPTTEIRFAVNRGGPGSLKVYNLKGELVATLLEGEIPAGPGSAFWNGRTDSGRTVASGVYVYRLVVGGEADAKRMMLLK